MAAVTFTPNRSGGGWRGRGPIHEARRDSYCSAAPFLTGAAQCAAGLGEVGQVAAVGALAGHRGHQDDRPAGAITSSAFWANSMWLRTLTAKSLVPGFRRHLLQRQARARCRRFSTTAGQSPQLVWRSAPPPARLPVTSETSRTMLAKDLPPSDVICATQCRQLPR